jgi:Ni,Fe-hydrogenase maturation factor
MAFRTLVIGYGNPDRADDGVAYHVVSAMRSRLGQGALADCGSSSGGTEYQPRRSGTEYQPCHSRTEYQPCHSRTEYQTGLDDLGADIDSILLTQLVPELVDTLGDYDQVIFVDAHVQEDAPDLHCASVLPDGTVSGFTHHMTPSMLLALFKALHHRDLVGYVVAIRGHGFGFGADLSTPTAALVLPAVEEILRLAASGVGPQA